MRIGLDCRKIYDIQTNLGAGVERYTYHFVRKLLQKDSHDDFVLFVYSDLSPETIHKLRGNNSRVKVVKIVRGDSKIPLWDNHLMFPLQIRKEKVEKMIFPSGSMPLFYFGQSILIVHDLAIYLNPAWFPDKQWFSTKIVVPESLKKAQTIIAVSENTKNDLIKLFGVAANKIKVIYPGIVVKSRYGLEEAPLVRQKFGIEKKYILFLGTVEPRKNLLNLLSAFSDYCVENPTGDVQFIIAGAKGWKSEPIFQLLSDVNARFGSEKVKYIGCVSNRERNVLIKNCQTFVFPSLYEGFGFPVLEAMSLGAAVITSDNSSLREVAGNAAMLVNPENITDIKNAIKKTLSDEAFRNELIEKGKNWASEFRWERTVEETMRLFG